MLAGWGKAQADRLGLGLAGTRVAASMQIDKDQIIQLLESLGRHNRVTSKVDRASLVTRGRH